MRERSRLQAVERFEDRQKNTEIAAGLRIGVRSVERWRRAWRESGGAGVLSKGSPGRPRLSEAQVVRLERELERGPLADGWADQQSRPSSEGRRSGAATPRPARCTRGRGWPRLRAHGGRLARRAGTRSQVLQRP
ncbi:helix-turn-helix domain-containing protein [Streptomyces adustus]|uniref:helix-turn-helix domain-containing protein n=1 Tax=Streptomyces adustus TaxID=1609272 RepID=UPI003717C144